MREHKSKSSAPKAGKRDASGDSSAKTPRVVVGSNLSRPGLLSKKNIKYVGLLLAVVFVGAVIYLAIKAVVPASSSKACNDEISQQANAANKMGNVTEMTFVAGKVKSLPKYDKDPNCVYILAEYEIVTEHFTAAQEHIDHLKSSYGSGYKFNMYLDDGKASVANLQKQYDTSKQGHDNANGVIDPDI